MARTTARTRKANAAKEATAKPAAGKTASRKTPTATKTAEQPALPPAQPRRHTPTSDFLTEAQIHGYLRARLADIDTPHIHGWRPHTDGTASHPLADGTLRYDHATRTLTWQAICRMGAWHTYPIGSRPGATQARIDAAQCEELHHDFDGVKPLTENEWADLGIHTAPADPAPNPAVRTLADQPTHSDTADTQPLSRQEIADGIAARADHDQPKEHPEP